MIDTNEIGGFIAHCTNIQYLMALAVQVRQRLIELSPPEVKQRMMRGERQTLEQIISDRKAALLDGLNRPASPTAAEPVVEVAQDIPGKRVELGSGNGPEINGAVHDNFRIETDGTAWTEQTEKDDDAGIPEPSAGLAGESQGE
jgi:hypothetical protein